MLKRFVRLSTLCVTLSLLVFFLVVTVSAAEFVNSGMIFYSSTQFGEDSSTQATIHFLTESETLDVFYTTADDTNFEKAIKVDYERVLVDFSKPLAKEPNKPLQQDEGFPAKFWEITGRLTTLTPGTKYMWYATDGKETSKVHNFMTSEGDNSTFTFSVTTDPQTYTAGARWERYNNWNKAIFETAAKNGMDIRFILNTGDIVENSGRAEHWGYTFGTDYHQKVVTMPTPGNHDFTGLVSSGGTDGRWFETMYGTPLNGPEEVWPEICYYFTYNDVLFVSLSCSCADRTAQVEWLDKVLKENPAQYKVVSMHYPANSASGDTSKEFIPIYQKYNVDIVLFGHTHTYAVQKNYIDMRPSSDDKVGTTYISASSSEGDYGKPVANQIFFTVNKDLISFRSLTPDSAPVDSIPFKTRRIPTSETKNYNEETFINSINVSIDQNTLKKGTVNYDASAYNNVYMLTLKNSEGAVIASKCVADSVNNYLTLSNLTPNTSYDTTLTLEYFDGTTKDVPVSFKTEISSYGTLKNLQEKMTSTGYRFTYMPEFRAEVKSLAIYVNDAKVGDATITDKLIKVDKEYLPEGAQHKIEIRAVLENGSESVIYEVLVGEASTDKMVTFVGMDDVEIAKVKVEEGKAATAPQAPVVPGYKFTGWDKDFSNVTADMTVKAIYAKTYTVTFLGKDGVEIAKVETVEGEAATAPNAPKVDGYAFKSWDKEFTNVTSDLTVNAVYEVSVKTYTVKFVDNTGKLISEVEVEEGKAATAPTAPAVSGSTFKSWSVDFSNVTSNLVVQAQYTSNSSSSCAMSGSVLLTSLMLLGLAFVRRRKF